MRHWSQKGGHTRRLSPREGREAWTQPLPSDLSRPKIHTMLLAGLSLALSLLFLYLPRVAAYYVYAPSSPCDMQSEPRSPSVTLAIVVL